ncbi:MAG: Pr6Pr family membrane protein [Ferruginibacter sp.]
MEKDSNNSQRLFLIAVAVIGWAAIIVQFYLIIANRTASVAETIARFFSFFTILTNILVALCCSLLLLKSATRMRRFFARPATLTAITLYIAVVGIIYNAILRFLWEPHGLQLIVDELLHSVIPVLFIVYWLLYVPKENLAFKNIPPSLLYPVIYCIYILIRGSVAGYYPYPFMDVKLLGYNKVFLNIGGMLIVFLFIAILLTGIAKLNLNKKTGRNKSNR